MHTIADVPVQLRDPSRAVAVFGAAAVGALVLAACEHFRMIDVVEMVRGVPVVLHPEARLALREEELRCRQAGMDAYLSKPVRLEQLKAAIDAWLRPAPTRPGVDGPAHCGGAV